MLSCCHPVQDLWGPRHEFSTVNLSPSVNPVRNREIARMIPPKTAMSSACQAG
jgi:hypothetical protein